MEPSSEPVVVSTGPLARMRELARVLGAKSLTASVVGSPGGSST